MRRSVLKCAGVVLFAAANTSSLLQALPAKAQPTGVQPRLPQYPLDDQAGIDKAIAQTEQEELAKTPISLKVSDATMDALIEKIQQLVPAMKNIEVRDAKPVLLSFDLKDVYAGQILQSAAGLAGCDLHIMSDRLLIAPMTELSKAENDERFQWTSNRLLYTDRRLQSLFVDRLTQYVQGQTTQKIQDGGPVSNELLYGNLGPKQQMMVQRLARWANIRMKPSIPRFVLQADTKISVEGEANGFTLRIDPGQKSDPNKKDVALSYTVFGNGR